MIAGEITRSAFCIWAFDVQFKANFGAQGARETLVSDERLARAESLRGGWLPSPP
jgi:hypothetical protein